jgi:hypothetical protein
MASGHVNRIKRPNTWLHPTNAAKCEKALANPEPSTHDPKRRNPPFYCLGSSCAMEWRPPLFGATQEELWIFHPKKAVIKKSIL